MVQLYDYVWLLCVFTYVIIVREAQLSAFSFAYLYKN